MLFNPICIFSEMNASHILDPVTQSQAIHIESVCPLSHETEMQ